MCERVGVLYAGRLVEEGPVEAILQDPRHPYTVGLIRCIPRGGVRKDRGRLDSIPGFLPAIGEELPGLRLRRALRRSREADLHDRGAAAAPRPAPGHSAAATSTSAPRELPRATAAELGVPLDGRPLRRAAAARSTTSRRSSASTGHEIHALDGVVGRDLARRDARPRRRVGQRQDDARAHAARARRARRAGTIELDGRALPALARALAGGRARAADRLPEPRLGAQPPPQRAADPAARAAQARRPDAASAAEQRLLELVAAGAARRALPDACARARSRAASSSASRSRARSPATRAWSSATSRPRRSTSRCRRRSSTCSSSSRRSERVAYLFISHDLGVVRYISDRIAVLYLGRLMELGPAEVVFVGPAPPLHRGAALGGADDRRRRPRADQARRRDPERRRAARAAASSTRAATASSARSASSRSRRCVEVEARAPDALPHPARGAAPPAGQPAAAAAAQEAIA